MIEVLKPGPVCVDVEGLSLTEHELSLIHI